MLNIDKNVLWKQVMAELEVSLSEGIFNMWIRPCSIEGILPVNDERVIVEIGVPTGFHRQTIDERYYGQIKQSMEKMLSCKCEISFKVVAGKETQTKRQRASQGDNLFEKSEDHKGVSESEIRQSGLNPKFSLTNFVVGGTNNLAFAAAKAVIENPGMRHNPFFIWGGTGVGKTHLMQSVGIELIKKGIEDVKYISSEQFTNSLIESLRNKTADAFKRKYRHVGALLVDDVQFFAGKDSSQEEFFHTFNELQMKGVQIIMTSDKKPQEISGVEERLVSRFLGGMTVDIGLPDFETKVAILRQKAEEFSLVIDSHIVELVASKVMTNTRELEGTFMRLVNAASAQGKPIDAKIVEEIIGIKQREESKKVRPVTVIGKLARQFNFKNKDIIGGCRKAEMVRARHIAMYLLKEDLKLTLVEIGELLGGRDHTTIMHGSEKISREFDINSEVREQVMAARSAIFS